MKTKDFNKVMNEIAPELLEEHNFSTLFSYRYTFALGWEAAMKSINKDQLLKDKVIKY